MPTPSTQLGQFFVALHRCGPAWGEQLETFDWQGTRIAPPRTYEAFRDGASPWRTRVPLQLDVTEELDADAEWCIYNDPDLTRPVARDKVGRRLLVGERFTIPLGGEWLGVIGLAPYRIR